MKQSPDVNIKKDLGSITKHVATKTAPLAIDQSRKGIKLGYIFGVPLLIKLFRLCWSVSSALLKWISFPLWGVLGLSVYCLGVIGAFITAKTTDERKQIIQRKRSDTNKGGKGKKALKAISYPVALIWLIPRFFVLRLVYAFEYTNRRFKEQRQKKLINVQNKRRISNQKLENWQEQRYQQFKETESPLVHKEVSENGASLISKLFKLVLDICLMIPKIALSSQKSILASVPVSDYRIDEVADSIELIETILGKITYEEFYVEHLSAKKDLAKIQRNLERIKSQKVTPITGKQVRQSTIEELEELIEESAVLERKVKKMYQDQSNVQKT